METPILIVEDNPADLETAIDALKLSPDQYDVADSVRSAKHLIGRRHYEAILLDLDLPDSRGVDTYRAIKRDAGGLCVVIVSGLDDLGTVKLAIDLGAEDFITKDSLSSDLLKLAIIRAQHRHRYYSEQLDELGRTIAEIKDNIDRTASAIDAIIEHLGRRTE